MTHYLIFVNYLNKDYKGDYIYEFIFSNTLVDVNGEEWDVYPASGNPSPPDEEFIHKVAKVETDVKLHVVQNSDTFSVWDCQENIVALAWEDISELDVYPDKRLIFNYGITEDKVTEILYERDITLNYYKI